MGGVDVEASKCEECVCGGRKAGKDAKGEGSRRAKRKKQDVGHGKGRNRKKREKGNVAGAIGDGADMSEAVQDVILRSKCTSHCMAG